MILPRILAATATNDPNSPSAVSMSLVAVFEFNGGARNLSWFRRLKQVGFLIASEFPMILTAWAPAIWAK